MGRPRRLKEARVVPLVLEREEYEMLKRLAHAQQTSVSALIRELVGQYLKTAGALPAAESGNGNGNGAVKENAPQRVAPLALDGGQLVLAETDGARRIRLLEKLDQPMVEGLVKDVGRLEAMVAELARTPVSMRRVESFLSRRGIARKKLIELKKTARYLIRAGANVPEDVVDRLAQIERALNALD
jgi:hypothetical protein